MEDNYLNGIHKFSVFILKLAYINFLWILFMIAGFGIFGFFPSTIATFSVVRQWIMGNPDTPIFKTFWDTYKKEFLRSNMLGVTYVFIGLILFIDIKYFSTPTNTITLILFYFFWVVAIIYLIFGFFLFPVYVHYQNKWWEYFKSTFMIMLVSPLTVLSFIVIILGAGTIMRVIPGLIPLFSCSGIAYALMLMSFRVFNRIELNSNESGERTRTVNT